MPSKAISAGDDPGTIAVIGAGSVGATIAYAVMLRGVATQIVLVDLNQAKAEGEAKDLEHGRRFVPSVRIRAGGLEACAGSQIIVITAGAKQHPGQSRLELALVNVEMFRDMIPKLAEIAPDAILLVVSNPVDVLTCAATRWHPHGDRRVFGSGTVLDSSRFTSLIAERIGVSVANVHAHIVGEHGESELPLWSSAHVGNISLSHFKVPGGKGLTRADRDEIITKVRSAAAEIIAAKGATNWAIGLAAARILEAIRRDENAVLTVSRVLHDYNGISDVALSVPCLVNAHGVGEPLDIRLSSDELEGLTHSASVLQNACRAAGL
jgi:L-lactate dehydrogenase